MPIDSSKFFDSIRIKPNKLSAKQQAQAREAAITCEWPECPNKGPHRASMFSELNGRGRWRPGPGGAETKPETRKIFNAERKALQVMGLGADATLEDVKAKYKALVKQHHPDANGGDRSTEDRLIEIIKAYNYLKTVVREA